jgi:hypothetical protein
MGIVRRRRGAAVSRWISANVRGRPRCGFGLRVSLTVTIGAAGLFGCAECPDYDLVDAPTPSVSRPARSSPARAATPVTRADPVRQAAATAPPKQSAMTIGAEHPQILKPQNEARFTLLHNVEAVGRSRTYTGDQSDPNSCAERCLAASGCEAFSFERETNLCYLVSQVTDLNANASFVSGRLR